MESDQPIQTSNQDRFGRKQFAQRIAQVVATREDKSGIVVGIYAPWGEGKTSVLNMIKEELAMQDQVLVIPFNPWYFTDDLQLLTGFFVDVARKFDASLRTRGEKLGSIANEYAEVLTVIPKAGNAVAAIVKNLTAKYAKSDIDQLKNQFSRVISESSIRLVVIMDDIDRLDKSEIQTVFKLVKLLADFPNTTYILAFDDKRVAEALKEKYGSIDAGRSFLEKIIQVPLPLPPTSKQARRTLALEGLESALKLAAVVLSNDENRRLGDIFDKAFLDRITTPRLAKRFGNALTFALPMVAGEVDIVDLIFLEAIRTFYPELYATIRDNPEVFLGSIFDSLSAVNEKEAKEHVEGTINTALEIYPEQVKKAASIVIQDLFPRTGASGLFRSGAYSSDFNERWNREKRVAATDYFSRYFNYGVPSDDISDRDVEAFLERVGRAAVEDLASEFSSLSSNNRTNVLIGKLRGREDELSAEKAAILSLVIAKIGNEIPYSHPTDRFFGLSTYSQASALIRHLLHRIPDQAARESLALDLAMQIEPLPLAYDYLTWIRKMKRSSYSDEMVSVVSEQCEKEIQVLIIQRLGRIADDEPIERSFPLDAQQLYRLWEFVDKGNLRDYLKRRIEAHPEEVAEFISAANGIDPNSESSRDWSVDTAWFDFICDLIPPEEVLRVLREIYPELASVEYNFDESRPMNNKERAARWFQRLYEQKHGAVIVPTDEIPEGE